MALFIVIRALGISLAQAWPCIALSAGPPIAEDVWRSTSLHLDQPAAPGASLVTAQPSPPVDTQAPAGTRTTTGIAATPPEAVNPEDLVRRANKVWADVIGQRSPVADLDQVFGGEWLRQNRADIQAMLATGRVRSASLQHLDVCNSHRVSNFREEINTAELWEDRTRASDGSIVDDKSGGVRQHYVFDWQAGRWLVTAAALERSHTALACLGGTSSPAPGLAPLTKPFLTATAAREPTDSPTPTIAAAIPPVAVAPATPSSEVAAPNAVDSLGLSVIVVIILIALVGVTHKMGSTSGAVAKRSSPPSPSPAVDPAAPAAELSVSLERYTVSMAAGGSAETIEVRVTNASEVVEAITFKLHGIDNTWYSFRAGAGDPGMPVLPLSMFPEYTTRFNLDIHPPGSASPGPYPLELIGESLSGAATRTRGALEITGTPDITTFRLDKTPLAGWLSAAFTVKLKNLGTADASVRLDAEHTNTHETGAGPADAARSGIASTSESVATLPAGDCSLAGLAAR